MGDKNVKSVLAEAEEVVAGPRADDYGSIGDDFERIAAMWSAILGVPVGARHDGAR